MPSVSDLTTRFAIEGCLIHNDPASFSAFEFVDFFPILNDRDDLALSLLCVIT